MRGKKELELINYNEKQLVQECRDKNTLHAYVNMPATAKQLYNCTNAQKYKCIYLKIAITSSGISSQ